MTDSVNIHEYDIDSDPTRYEAEDRERFQITDDSQAAWAMRKLLALRTKMQANEKIADHERTRIDAWLDHENGKYTNDVAYFEAILTQYARQQREADNRKTIETPYGVVKSRATQNKFRVLDEQAFLDWAEANMPEAINVKRTPALSVLKESVTVEKTDSLGLVAMLEHGEIIPGVTVDPADVNYTVEVTK